MKIRNAVMSLKSTAVATVLSVGAVSAPVFAQGTTGSLSGLSAVLTGLDTTDAIAAIVGAAAILAAVGFAKWASKKVGKFFG